MNDYSYLTGPHWEKIGICQHHGVCIPLSSVYTESSCGIGEFLDLVPLLLWLKDIGFNLIQLLPLNDTRDDPSPYMSVSSVALHPIYLSLHALPGAEKLDEFQKILAKLRRLNQRERVSYHEVLQKKMDALSIYLKHNIAHIEEESSFQTFIHENGSWLLPYAHFSALKQAHEGKAWWDWDASSQEKEATLCHEEQSALAQGIRFWQAVQYLCFCQLRKIKELADTLHIHILGDIPILINKDSADVFWHQDLFSFDKVVGAPPDMYNKEGQCWGFPLFRWSNHKREHFAWWKERISFQESLYHLYRLDHIVGFYRLWAITPGSPAREGIFLPKTPPEWKRLGETVLKTIVQTSLMLPIGEDLGDIPDLVKTSMHEIGIPGMKVLRWERAWHKDQSFIHPRSFSPESLSTLSTHDSSTLEGWWNEAPQECERMARDYGIPYTQKLTKTLRTKILSLCHRSGSLFHVNPLSEYLALFKELSWNDPHFDRINVPGTTSPDNWSFRYKTSLEEIITHKKLALVMKSFSSSL